MNSNGNSLFQPRATVGSILSERNNFLYSKNACKKLSGEGQERGHAPVLRRVASGSNLPRWRRVDELNDCETVMREMNVSEDRTKRMDPSSPLPVILPPRRGTAFSMTSVMSIPRNSVVEHGDYEGLMTVISGDLSYPILSQLFFHFIVDEHNDLVSHIRGLNEEAFVSRVRSKGKRSGMRRVGLSDAHFLLTASLDTKNKEKTGQSSDYAANYHAEFSDVKALFNLADWRQKGSVDFETFIHTLHLLFRPKSIFGVLWCRALLRTKQLDTAVLTLEEVEIVLQAVMDTFSRYDSDKITSICRAVRREVMMVSIDACVPVSFLRDVMQKFPTLSKYLNLINEDGTVQSPVPPVDEMRELVRGPADTKVYIRSPSCTGRSAVRRRNRLAFERTEENSKVVEFVRDIYARGDSHSWTSPSEGYAALQRAAKHPRFICDQYADKTRPATPPLQLPNFAAVPPCPATSLALSYLQPKEPRYIEGSSST